MRLTAALLIGLAATACQRDAEPERPDPRQAASLDEAEAMLDEDAANEAAAAPSPQ